MPERILVGVDSSAPSKAALVWALERAVLRGVTEITAMHVIDDPKHFPGSARGDRATEREERVLAQRTHAVASLAPDVSIRPVVVRGTVCETMAEASAAFDVVVVGTHASDTVTKQKEHSLGLRLARRCLSTTVIVPERRASRGRQIVVGVDLPGASVPAFDFAAAEAEKTHSDLSLLTVHANTTDGDTRAESTREQVDALELAASRVRADHPHLSITRSIVSGSAPAAFARSSYGARMIVLGAPDADPIGASTFDQIVRSSAVPVAVAGTKPPQ